MKYIKKVAEIDNGVLLDNEGLTDSHSTTTYSISDLFALVKQYDAEFSPKPVNPAFLNEDGTAKVFYHGTDAEWTVYDLSKNKNQMWGEGIYLTPDYDGDPNVYCWNYFYTPVKIGEEAVGVSIAV